MMGVVPIDMAQVQIRPVRYPSSRHIQPGSLNADQLYQRLRAIEEAFGSVGGNRDRRIVDLEPVRLRDNRLLVRVRRASGNNAPGTHSETNLRSAAQSHTVARRQFLAQRLGRNIVLCYTRPEVERPL